MASPPAQQKLVASPGSRRYPSIPILLYHSTYTKRSTAVSGFNLESSWYSQGWTSACTDAMDGATRPEVEIVLANGFLFALVSRRSPQQQKRSALRRWATITKTQAGSAMAISSPPCGISEAGRSPQGFPVRPGQAPSSTNPSSGCGQHCHMSCSNPSRNSGRCR